MREADSAEDAVRVRHRQREAQVAAHLLCLHGLPESEQNIEARLSKKP